MLSWLAVDAERASIQDDLERRSRAALAAEGHDWASVAFDGREALVVGQAVGERAREKAVEVVRGVWGVRSVRTTGSAGAIADVPVGRVAAAAPPSTLDDVSPGVIGDLPPGSSTWVRAGQGTAVAYLPPVVHVRARDAGTVATVAMGSVPDGIDKPLSPAPAQETLLAGSNRGERVPASATAGESIPAARSLASAEPDPVMVPLQKSGESPSPPLPERKGVVATARAVHAELEGVADAGAKPRGGLPTPRFETAALPPSNIPSEATCISDVKGAARRVEVHFAHGDARLDAAGKAVIDALAAALAACREAGLQVAGHADASGLSRRNEVLSRQRARVVVGYLVDKGIDAGRLVAVGYGDKRPVAPNDTQVNRAKNRRIEVTITAREAPLPPMPVRKQGTRNGLSDR